MMLTSAFHWLPLSVSRVTAIPMVRKLSVSRQRRLFFIVVPVHGDLCSAGAWGQDPIEQKGSQTNGVGSICRNHKYFS